MNRSYSTQLFYLQLIQYLRYYSRVQLIYSIQLSIYRQKVVNIFLLVPIYLYNNFQNLDIKSLFLSNTISTSILYQLITILNSTFKKSLVSITLLYIIKQAIFISLYITTRIMLYIQFSYILEDSSLTIKPRAINFYSSSSILEDIITLYSLQQLILFYIYILYSYTIVVTIYLIPRKQYIFTNYYLVFLIPQQLQAGSLQFSLVSSFHSLVRIYILPRKVSLFLESYSKPLANTFVCYQTIVSVLYSLYISQSYSSPIAASQCTRTRVSLFFLSIA